MRKIGFFAVVVTVFFIISGISSGQESGEAKGSMKHMKEGTTEGWAGMRHMPVMRNMIMRGMMAREMVATSDGGVIVLIGNKLIKYDKDLNLVKEVTIKMDMKGMAKMMKEMKEKCSMFREEMQGGGMMEKGSHQ